MGAGEVASCPLTSQADVQSAAGCHPNVQYSIKEVGASCPRPRLREPLGESGGPSSGLEQMVQLSPASSPMCCPDSRICGPRAAGCEVKRWRCRPMLLCALGVLNHPSSVNLPWQPRTDGPMRQEGIHLPRGPHCVIEGGGGLPKSG